MRAESAWTVSNIFCSFPEEVIGPSHPPGAASGGGEEGAGPELLSLSDSGFHLFNRFGEWRSVSDIS